MITKQLQHQPEISSQDFCTQELALVCALVVWGFPIKYIDRTDITRVSFYLERSDELDQAIQSFWNGSGVVIPKLYFNSLRELKSRIRGG